MVYEVIADVKYPFRVEADNIREAHKFLEILLWDGNLFNKYVMSELAMSSYDIEDVYEADKRLTPEFNSEFVKKMIDKYGECV